MPGMQCSPAAGRMEFLPSFSRFRATAGREEGLQQSPPQRLRRSRRIAYTPAAVPCYSGALLLRCPATPVPCCSVAQLPPPSPSALRAPKHAILGSRPWKYTPPCPKTCHFGFPTLEIHPSVPQNMPFWTPNPGNTALPLGRTRTFCPSAPRPHAGSLGLQQKWGRSCNLLRRFFYFCICINR